MAPPGGTRPVGHGRNLSLPAIWNVPHRRNPSFTGRGDLLEALHGSGGETQPVVLTQVLRGLGGIGKTQLALQEFHFYLIAEQVMVISGRITNLHLVQLSQSATGLYLRN